MAAANIRSPVRAALGRLLGGVLVCALASAMVGCGGASPTALTRYGASVDALCRSYYASGPAPLSRGAAPALRAALRASVAVPAVAAPMVRQLKLAIRRRLALEQRLVQEQIHGKGGGALLSQELRQAWSAMLAAEHRLHITACAPTGRGRPLVAG
jgi:hypothetical protein